MSAAPKPKMTVEEFERYAPEHGRCELINGEVHDLTPTGFDHGRITNRLSYHVSAWVYEHELGEVFAAETGFRPDGQSTVRAPDVAFIKQDRIPDPTPPSFANLMPDLIAETVSPSDRVGPVSEKTRWWLNQGVHLVWIVEPQTRTVTAYQPDGSARVFVETESLTGDPVLPGFQLPVARLFA